jgi:DNA-binding LytR/AlgR family response regulator
LNTRLKCLLLDDELPGLMYLKLLCEQIPELEVIKTFNDPVIFLREFEANECDLCILDIEMPGVDGLQLASRLNGKPVIFVTAFKEYALDAFGLDAVDYLQKPVRIERLRQAVQKALKRVENYVVPVNFIQLNTDKGRALLYFDQLLYIRASGTDSRDKIALMQNNSTFLLKNISFDKLLISLPRSHFCRINKKEVIAIRSVNFFSHAEITTWIIKENGQPLVLSLSEKYRKNFIQEVNF